jgi:hypothetical protein
MAWQTFTVRLKGEDPIEVAPNALDWRFVRVDAGAPMDAMFQSIHRALLRVGAPVPRDYQGYLEALDAIPEATDDDDEVGPLDPTVEGP